MANGKNSCVSAFINERCPMIYVSGDIPSGESSHQARVLCHDRTHAGSPLTAEHLLFHGEIGDKGTVTGGAR